MLEVGIFVFGIKIPSVAEDEKTGGKVNRDTIVSWQKCSKRTMSATNDHQFFSNDGPTTRFILTLASAVQE